VADLGKLMLFAGLALAVVGALLWVAPQIPWLGKLPGDLQIERPGLRIHVPIATSILISLILTLVLNLIARWR
jgi:hypothetical protein